MDLLERIFGVEAVRRAREAANAARTGAQLPEPPQPKRVAATLRPAATGAPVRVPAPPAQQAAADEPFGPATDFPTSILGSTSPVAPPLLAAFGSRDALLAAIVYSEALAPPAALR